LGKIDEAEQAAKRALELDADNADAWDLLGLVLQQQNKLPDAAGCHLKAVALNAQKPAYHANLGDAVLKQGHAERALDAYRNALALNPNDASVHSRVLVAMGRSGKFGFREIYDEAVAWGRRHAHAVGDPYADYPNTRDPDRRLRVGYVSPNFTGDWMLELLTNHDPAKVEIFCYSDGRPDDPATQPLKSTGVTWREVAGLPDARFCQVVREDQIDILVDLAGHLPGNRLLAFARRPAPVQVTWGFPHTTGMSEMNYRIVNPGAEDQMRAEKYHTEKLVQIAGLGAERVTSLEEAYRTIWKAWCNA
jgi:protein O-GlcNAc transferase